MLRVANVAQAIAGDDRFRSAILGLIVLNALCLGVEAVPELEEHYSELLAWILAISQVVFVIEIALRIAAHYPRPRTFFTDSWNRFDFLIVAASLLPAVGDATLAVRALRVLRIFRLVSVSQTLRGAFYADTRDRVQAGLAALTLVILVYVFALIGFHLFGEWNPAQWGTLGRALASVVGLLTVVNASAIVSPGYAMSPSTLLYFMVLYLVVAAYVFNGARALVHAVTDFQSRS